MKQPIKNEADILNLISKIQVHLFALDQKMNTLINRSAPAGSKPLPVAPVPSPRIEVRPKDHHKERTMYSAVCADCQKECQIPFKPSGDRPVYCQECFSRRKSGNQPKPTVNETPKTAVPAPTVTKNVVAAQKPEAKKKKKAAPVKKAAAKKKAVAKKKK